MKMPRVRRRWVVLALVIVAVIVVLRLLYQPVTLESYRKVDPQTLVVYGYGAPGTWARVSDVAESASSVTITVNALTFEPYPHTDVGGRLQIEVHLNAPLGSRAVFDGSTGQPMAEVGGQ